MYDYDDLLCLKRTIWSFLDVNNFDLTNDTFDTDWTKQTFKRSLKKSNINEKLANLIEAYDAKCNKNDEFAANYQKNKKCIETYIQEYDKLSLIDRHRNNMSNVYRHKTIPDLNILVYFLGESSLTSISNKYLKTICQIMIYLGCRECIIITYNEPSNQFKKEMTSLNIDRPYDDSSKIFRIISYTDSNFIDLTRHAYIPKIVKIYRNKDAEQFLEENNFESVDLLPKIRLDDPVCKFYRCRLNDIIELVRESGLDNNLIDTHISYRHVSN